MVSSGTPKDPQNVNTRKSLCRQRQGKQVQCTLPVHVKCVSGFAGLLNWSRTYIFGSFAFSSSILSMIPWNPSLGSVETPKNAKLKKMVVLWLYEGLL